MTTATASLTTVSAVVFIALAVAMFFGLLANPYAGLVVFIALPALFVIGLLLIQVFAFGLGVFRIIDAESPWSTFFSTTRWISVRLPAEASRLDSRRRPHNTWSPQKMNSGR